MSNSLKSISTWIACSALKACSVVVLLLLARGAVWLINMLVIAPIFDPLKNMQGPKASFFQNHFRELMDPTCSPETYENWVKAYGQTFRFHGFGRHDYRLFSIDFRVISHVLNSPFYEKPWQTRSLLSSLFGRGVFAMEGEEHKYLRKLIAPAFSTQSIRAMTPIFFQKAEEVRDRWQLLTEQSTSIDGDGLPLLPFPLSPPSPSVVETVLDVSLWFSRATFDVIGLAGFDYHFQSLRHESEDVYVAYRNMFKVADMNRGVRGLFQLYFPICEKLWPDKGSRILNENRAIIREVGEKLVQSKKTTILAENMSEKNTNEKDILSLLIMANLSADASKRISDTDLLDQLSTFLFAGSDSTALTMAWCAHLLSLNPDVQTRVRNEVLSLSACSPNTTSYSPECHAGAIDALPYLNAVVHETLRLCPPVHGTMRVATCDDDIPVSSPILLCDGTMVREGETLRIRKGSYVHVPIEALNFSEDIWGPGARSFNPDRWFSLPQSARAPAHPGIANLMTFSFGPHACPGWKFSVLQTKIFIATLLPHFVFEPAADVQKFNAVLTRPYVYDQFEHGARLPLKVGKYCST